jgi:hypothetical protein
MNTSKYDLTAAVTAAAKAGVSVEQWLQNNTNERVCSCCSMAATCLFNNKSAYVYGTLAAESSVDISVVRVLYRRWHQMLQRCSCPKDSSYRYYGGRGITVGADMQDILDYINVVTSIPTFTAEVQAGLTRPGRNYELDRIDNDGPYTGSNIRWVTPADNKRNSRCAIHLHAYVGGMYGVGKLAEMTGISVNVLEYRLNKLGMTVDAVIAAAASRPYRKRGSTFEYSGKAYTPAEFRTAVLQDRVSLAWVYRMLSRGLSAAAILDAAGTV